MQRIRIVGFVSVVYVYVQMHACVRALGVWIATSREIAFDLMAIVLDFVCVAL